MVTAAETAGLGAAAEAASAATVATVASVAAASVAVGAATSAAVGAATLAAVGVVTLVAEGAATEGRMVSLPRPTPLADREAGTAVVVTAAAAVTTGGTSLSSAVVRAVGMAVREVVAHMMIDLEAAASETVTTGGQAATWTLSDPETVELVAAETTTGPETTTRASAAMRVGDTKILGNCDAIKEAIALVLWWVSKLLSLTPSSQSLHIPSPPRVSRFIIPGTTWATTATSKRAFGRSTSHR